MFPIVYSDYTLMEIALSKVTPLTSAQVAIKVAQVDAFVAEGYKAYKACEKVGIPRVTYFKFKQRAKKHNPETEMGEPPAKESRPTTDNPGDRATQSPSGSSVAHDSHDQAAA